MYTANLSFTLLEKYIEITVAAGFIKLEGYKYWLTEQGREFLSKYKLFYERYNKAQQMLDSLEAERETLAKLCQASEFVNSDETVLDAETKFSP